MEPIDSKREYVLVVLRGTDDVDRSGLAIACRLLWGGYQQASGWRITDVEAECGAARLVAALKGVNLREVATGSTKYGERLANARQIIRNNAPAEIQRQ